MPNRDGTGSRWDRPGRGLGPCGRGRARGRGWQKAGFEDAETKKMQKDIE